MKTVQGKYTTAYIYTDIVEDYALAQIRQLCDQQVFKDCRIRMMPDVHPGKVGPIGFTSTVGESVMPAVIGIDIGCGMTMAKITKGKSDFQKLDTVIRENIPSGFGKRNKPHRFAEDFGFDKLRCITHINVARAKASLGTLGGGNHFIELDQDPDGNIYIVIHSGSRHLGKEVAEYYLNAGRDALKAQGIEAAFELTWLDGQIKEDYLHDIAVVQGFAFENRRALLDEITSGMKWKTEEALHCIHNYIDFTGNTPVMRKGAISAKAGEEVIIPINMRDGIILGKGLGNVEWNESAPHGAGRLMSREQVKNQYTVSQFKKAMKGIHSESIGKDTLDEAPFAYRSIDDILPYLKETVEVRQILKPVYNFKAGGDD